LFPGSQHKYPGARKSKEKEINREIERLDFAPTQIGKKMEEVQEG